LSNTGCRLHINFYVAFISTVRVGRPEEPLEPEPL
jgi:hypothetical protein